MSFFLLTSLSCSFSSLSLVLTRVFRMDWFLLVATVRDCNYRVDATGCYLRRSAQNAFIPCLKTWVFCWHLVRHVFQGKVTYFSFPFEGVNWDIFDFLGIDIYRDSINRDYYDRTLRSLIGKPVVFGEFGCCAFRGADKLGGSGFMIIFGMMGDSVELKLPPPVSSMIKIPTQID